MIEKSGKKVTCGLGQKLLRGTGRLRKKEAGREMAGFADWRKSGRDVWKNHAGRRNGISSGCGLYGAAAICMTDIMGLGRQNSSFTGMWVHGAALDGDFAAVKAAGGCKGDAGVSGAGKKGGNGTLPGIWIKEKAGTWLPELFLLAYGAAGDTFSLSFFP